jgi:gluconolactonase
MKLLTFTALVICTLASGCAQHALAPEAASVNVPALPAWAANCRGQAPSGDMTAQRIEGANSTRTEAGLYEGPVWLDGALLFSDFTFGKGFPSRIRQLDTAGKLRTVLEDSGSNGLALDAQGKLMAAMHKNKSISRLDLNAKTGQILTQQFNGNPFNSPNDLTLAGDGSVYFTDPDFQRDAAPGGQPKTRVYRLSAQGDLSVVDDSLKNPNGIALSPDESVLYVNGNAEQAVVRAYPIVNHVPQAGHDLVTGLLYPDGMTVDCHGNLYVTEHTRQHLRVFSAKGTALATIQVDANITNAAFGGAQGKTLYITGAGAVWKIALDVSGSPY